MKSCLFTALFLVFFAIACGGGDGTSNDSSGDGSSSGGTGDGSTGGTGGTGGTGSSAISNTLFSSDTSAASLASSVVSAVNTVSNIVPPSSSMDSRTSVYSSGISSALITRIIDAVRLELNSTVSCSFNNTIGMYICDGVPANCDCDTCLPIDDTLASSASGGNANTGQFMCYPPKIDVILGFFNPPDCDTDNTRPGCNTNKTTPAGVTHSSMKVFTLANGDTVKSTDIKWRYSGTTGTEWKPGISRTFYYRDSSNTEKTFTPSDISSFTYQCPDTTSWKTNNNTCYKQVASLGNENSCFESFIPDFCPYYYQTQNSIADMYNFWSGMVDSFQESGCDGNTVYNAGSYTSTIGATSCNLSEFNLTKASLSYNQEDFRRLKGLLKVFDCLAKRKSMKVANTNGGIFQSIGEEVDMMDVVQEEIAKLPSGCTTPTGDTYNTWLSQVISMKMKYLGKIVKKDFYDPTSSNLNHTTDITYNRFKTTMNLRFNLDGTSDDDDVEWPTDKQISTSDNSVCYYCYHGLPGTTTWCNHWMAQKGLTKQDCETNLSYNANLCWGAGEGTVGSYSDLNRVKQLYADLLKVVSTVDYADASLFNENANYKMSRIDGSAYLINMKRGYTWHNHNDYNDLIKRITFSNYKTYGSSKDIQLSDVHTFSYNSAFTYPPPQCQMNIYRECCFNQSGSFYTNHSSLCNYLKDPSYGHCNDRLTNGNNFEDINTFDKAKATASTQYRLLKGTFAGRSEFAQYDNASSSGSEDYKVYQFTTLSRKTNPTDTRMSGCTQIKIYYHSNWNQYISGELDSSSNCDTDFQACLGGLCTQYYYNCKNHTPSLCSSFYSECKDQGVALSCERYDKFCKLYLSSDCSTYYTACKTDGNLASTACATYWRYCSAYEPSECSSLFSTCYASGDETSTACSNYWAFCLNYTPTNCTAFYSSCQDTGNCDDYYKYCANVAEEQVVDPNSIAAEYNLPQEPNLCGSIAAGEAHCPGTVECWDKNGKVLVAQYVTDTNAKQFRQAMPHLTKKQTFYRILQYLKNPARYLPTAFNTAIGENSNEASEFSGGSFE